MPRDLFEQQATQGKDLFESTGVAPRDYSFLQSLYGGAATTAKRGILGIEQAIESNKPDIGNFIWKGKGEEPQWQPNQAVLNELANRNAMNEAEYGAIEKSSPVGTFLGSIIGGTALIAPTLAMPGAGPVAGAGIIRGIAAPLAARAGAEGALYGSMNYVNEGQTRLGNAGETAAMSALGGGLLGTGAGLAGKGYQAAKNANPWGLLRGNLSDEQLLKNLTGARGTETPLGHVIENPNLMRFEEHVLPRVPGSGMAQSQQRVADQLRGKTEDILGNLGAGKIPEDKTLEQLLHENLYQGTSQARQKNSQLYGNVRQIAEEFNVDSVPNTHEYNTAKSLLEKAEKDKRFGAALSEDKILKDDLLRIVRGENEVMNPATGQTAYQPLNRDFITAHFDRSKYLENERAVNWDNRAVKTAYLDLSKAMTKDMDAAAKNSGVPELMKAYKKATDDYKRHILPLTANKKLAQTQKRLPGYEGNEVIFPEEISEKIPGMIINGGRKNDYVSSINSFMKYLDKEGKNLLLQSHFRKTVDSSGEIDPMAFIGAWRSLGNRQKTALFSHNPKVVEKFEELDLLQKLNPKAFQTMFNPPTGQQALDYATLASIAGSGAGFGAAAGGPLGGLIGAALAFPGAAVASKKLTGILTSEKSREYIVKKLLEGVKKGEKDMTENHRIMKILNETIDKTGRPLLRGQGEKQNE